MGVCVWDCVVLWQLGCGTLRDVCYDGPAHSRWHEPRCPRRRIPIAGELGRVYGGAAPPYTVDRSVNAAPDSSTQFLGHPSTRSSGLQLTNQDDLLWLVSTDAAVAAGAPAVSLRRNTGSPGDRVQSALRLAQSAKRGASASAVFSTSQHPTEVVAATAAELPQDLLPGTPGFARIDWRNSILLNLTVQSAYVLTSIRCR
jgi:hypothetical protein